ncbi:hypothetical protein SDC9_92098 [bioreactor metagenome]|uniref:Chemotaxis phosphatase CheX-like domain-containing protein n=1 Tax=bioreactor metagenome TaxID=1076179 RepID=A0A644ZZL6_9ZZZZ
MFTQYFGNFLFESGIITRDQFKHCLQEVPARRAKLGVLAMEAGYMVPAQVEEIHGLQLRTDKRFGELAVEREFLTPEQLERLLAVQPSAFSVFSQILCDEGYLTYGQLSLLTEDYRMQCGMSAEGFAQFKDNNAKPLIERLLASVTSGQDKKDLVSIYLDVFAKNIQRFISLDVVFGGLEPADVMEEEWIARQSLCGAHSMITALGADEAAARAFAGAFANRDFETFDLMARDVMGEFMNCNNGIFSLNMVERGSNLDMEPQEIRNVQADRALPGMLGLRFSIDRHFYRLYLAF